MFNKQFRSLLGLIMLSLLAIGSTNSNNNTVPESQPVPESNNSVESVPGIDDNDLKSLCAAGCKAYGEPGSVTYQNCVYCCTHDCDK